MADDTYDSRSDPDLRTQVEPSGAPSIETSAGDLLTIGEQLGRFVVLSKLGEGGMALVYAAYDAELDRKVALKVLRSDPRGGRSSQGQARLLREAQAMARLSHPHIVQVYEVGKLGRDVFIAMEFIQGQTLRAWLKARQRGWRELVPVFLQAGEGLAAAHAAGIVHRDFKPDNVLLGDDGRVRVLDFGLARPGDPAERAVDLSASNPQLRPLEDIELTQAGAYIGTPAYMSPEQQLSLVADARSDQFGFCVALYEGLYGVRPFAGESAAELRRNVTRGRISPPPRGADVPERLRALVLRGLAVDPAERFPTMTDLLAALRRDPSEHRRRWIAGGVALAGVATLTGALLAARASGPACEADDGLAGVWDTSRRDDVRTTFMATGLPFAGATLARVERDLDRFAAAWTRQARAQCEATRDEVAARSAELGALCLDRRRSELRALVDVFARADAATVEHASGAIDRLRDPALCADPSALAAELALAPLPADRSIAAAVWTLRERLAGVRVLESAGRYDEGAQQIAALLDEARALGDASVLAEALLLQAILAGKRTDYPAADRSLRAALSEAERAGHHALRAEAMVYRIELVGFLQARPDAVEDWLDPTLALVRHVTPGSALEGRALVNLGLMRYRQGDLAGSVEAHEQAIALLSRVLKEGDPLFIGALLDLGRSYLRAGRREDSLRTLTRARGLAERELGPEHPILISLYLNLANADDANESLYRRSLDLATRTFGPDHASGAMAMSNLGLVYASRGDYARALDFYRRAAAVNRKTLGVHPSTAIPYTNAGDALIHLGRHEEALASLLEAMRMYDELYPEGNPTALTTLINLGDVTRRLGRLEESRGYLRRAREISLKHRDSVAFVAMELADTLTALGAGAEALELLASLDPKVDLGPVFETHRAWLRAKALWTASPPDRPRARATIEAIEATLLARVADPETGDGNRRMSRTQLADVRTWLSEHVREDRPKRR